MMPVIPPEALGAAKDAMREVTPPPGISKSDWIAEHGTWALFAGAIAAAAPFIAVQALTEAATDLQDAIRGAGAGTLHATTTDVGWLHRRADQIRAAHQ